MVSGFDENLIMVSYDNFEVMMYQKLNSSKIRDLEPVEDCHDISVNIYDAIALKVNISSVKCNHVMTSQPDLPKLTHDSKIALL